MDIFEIRYMQAKLLALAYQQRFFGNGDKHPFFDFAVTELTYYLQAVSNLRGNRIGQRIARSFLKYLEDEPQEKKDNKRYVLPLSKNQAYRIAEEIVKKNIERHTAYEIELLLDKDNNETTTRPISPADLRRLMDISPF
jgi:hypothetical protein